MFTNLFKTTLLTIGASSLLLGSLAKADDYVLHGQGGVNANRYASQPYAARQFTPAYAMPFRMIPVMAAVRVAPTPSVSLSAPAPMRAVPTAAPQVTVATQNDRK